MSLLGKKTYIEKVLDSLSENELKSVINLINTMDTREPTFVSLDPISSNFISNSNKGVSYVSFQLDNLLNLIVKGILIYNNSFCGLFAKGSHNNIEEYKIDVSKRTFVRVYENLTAEEFRQVCNDTLFAMSGGGGGGGSPSFAVAFHYTGVCHDEAEQPESEERFYFDVVEEEANTVLSDFPSSVYFDDLMHQLQLLLKVDIESLQMAVYNVTEDSDQYTVQFMRSGGELTITGWKRRIGGDSVSGTNDGTNWTSLTINSDTYGIPQGGGGGSGTEEIYPINIVATPNSTNIELAPAQNITLADMGEQAPGFTAAPYQTLNPVTFVKNYDAVLAEFGAGHLYLLPLISADSSMLMYGLAEDGMPVFDVEHPCAIMIQLNGSSIDSVMMISNSTYGPDGTSVATSLKGYFYSDTVFSFNASGIRDTDIAAAISAGKLPVAIIEWKNKDYTSWCPIKSFDEEDYYFEGEYKEQAFRLECDGSYWLLTWLSTYVEDKQLGADVDYANNKIYFRSLDAMRDMQSGLPMVKLELHDYTDADRPLLGYLQLTLASQNDDGTENYYSAAQVDNDDIKVTALLVTSSDTLSGGSQIKQVLAENGGTNVVANPTLEGTESDLIGLEVAGTKYKVSQGSSGTLSLSTNLVGKKLSLIGDSITTYSGWLPSGNVSRYPRGAITDVNQTWWKMLLDETGMIIGQNCAWDGSTCIGRSTSTTNAYGACSAKRISQLGLNGNPDIIICFIGINDWGATYNNTGTHYGSPFTNGAFVPVGSYTGETAAPSGDLQTFSEAYGSMIYNIQVNYPNAKIYCCTLLQTNGKATYNYDADGVFPSINRNGVTLAAYNECIRTLAKNMGAEVIDFAKCGINWGNMSTYLEDGLHPNKAGMKLLTEAAKAKLIADFGYVAQATPTTTFTVTNNLSHATSNNGSTSVAENSSYTATISPASGYEILSNNVSITMGGTDITSSVWNNGVISIASVTGNIVINVVATVIVGTTYTITNSLTNVTNSNSTTSVAENATYTATLTADTGYSISSVSVTMGGTDVTSTVYNNGNINISAVTGNVVITASATPVAYSITNNLTNATSDNAASTINYGSSYSATITATSGYQITSASVTMGGVDITNTAYNNGVISIASVTGNLVITITAADPTVITWYTNFSQTNTSSFVASSRGWALDETTYANIYNKPINRISLVATANSGSIDICVAPSKNAQSGFTQQQTINWTSDNKVGNIVTFELDTPITLSNGQYLCVYVNSVPATGVACYANGGNAGQFYSYVGSSGHGTWGDKGSYSIQMNIGYKA